MNSFIKVYEHGIPDELCDKLIATMDTNKKLASKTDQPWRRCLMLAYPNKSIEGSDALFGRLKGAIKSLFHKYKDSIGESGGRGTLNFCSRLERPNIILYKPSEDKQEMFHNHSDNWSQDSATRQVSVIIYLNDVEDGGCTVFPHYDMSVKPKKGLVLLFPSFFMYTHRAEPPKSGPKYVVVTWLHFGGKATKYFSYGI